MTPTLAASAFDSLRLDAVSDQGALRRAYELPSDAAVRKQMTELTEQTRRLIGCASLVLVASADAEGNFDVSPRGGPAGFVAVLDARTVAIPDATGNKRLDTLQNVIATGRAGLLFVIPGRATTLRMNGDLFLRLPGDQLVEDAPVAVEPQRVHRNAAVAEHDQFIGRAPGGDKAASGPSRSAVPLEARTG
jgi:predicted pyridoxine 5'-phosphate oxidase superfamily flavin-nucleotide-binding protein